MLVMPAPDDLGDRPIDPPHSGYREALPDPDAGVTLGETTFEKVNSQLSPKVDCHVLPFDPFLAKGEPGSAQTERICSRCRAPRHLATRDEVYLFVSK